MENSAIHQQITDLELEDITGRDFGNISYRKRDVYRYILLIAFVGYYLMGVKIFQALETDIQEELKNSFLEAREALMSNYANITPEELEIFLQRKIKIHALLFFFGDWTCHFHLPPLLFMHTEGWTYKEGLCFAFISLSTIGFGDYVLGINPSQNYSKIYPAIIILWCTFGLAWITLLFDLFSKILDKS